MEVAVYMVPHGSRATLLSGSPWQWAALMNQFPCNFHKSSGQ